MIDLFSLRTALRSHIGVDDTDLNDNDTDLLLNRAYWEIIDKFHFREKEVTVTFPTSVGVRRYNMPSPFEALRRLSILNPDNGEHSVLERMTTDKYENVYDEDEDAWGFPVEYLREDCTVKLWPTPDEIYTMTLKYWTVLADLNEDEANPDIPQAWHEIILLGGVWRGFTQFGDYLRSKQAQAQQIGLINSMVPTEAKEEYDSPRAGIEVPGRYYDV